MKDKEPITAEEFCKQYLKENWKSNYDSMDVVNILMPKAMVLFAKYHRERIIESVKQKIEPLSERELKGAEKTENSSMQFTYIRHCAMYDAYSISLSSIENAYKEENII